jgi:hypothetical protein
MVVIFLKPVANDILGGDDAESSGSRTQPKQGAPMYIMGPNGLLLSALSDSFPSHQTESLPGFACVCWSSVSSAHCIRSDIPFGFPVFGRKQTACAAGRKLGGVKSVGTYNRKETVHGDGYTDVERRLIKCSDDFWVDVGNWVECSGCCKRCYCS